MVNTYYDQLKRPLTDLVNINFALGCKVYGLSIAEAAKCYSEMFPTGDKEEILRFVKIHHKPIKKIFFIPYVLAAYLSDRWKNKASFHRQFIEIYSLSEKQFQTDRASQYDVNSVIASIWSFKKDLKGRVDENRANELALSVMKYAYSELESIDIDFQAVI